VMVTPAKSRKSRVGGSWAQTRPAVLKKATAPHNNHEFSLFIIGYLCFGVCCYEQERLQCEHLKNG